MIAAQQQFCCPVKIGYIGMSDAKYWSLTSIPPDVYECAYACKDWPTCRSLGTTVHLYLIIGRSPTAMQVSWKGSSSSVNVCVIYVNA